MKIGKEQLKSAAKDSLAFLKWVLFACIIGAVVGGTAIAFYFCFVYVTDLRSGISWLLYLLPLGGLAIVGIYKLCGMEKDRGTNFVLAAVRENAAMPLRTAPLVFISTLITHLFGGSSGREGAILQIGGSISSTIGRKMHLDDKDSRVITMCGMSAAFAALFGTPLTAAVFAMEIVSVGVMYYSAIVPCTLAAVIGSMLAKLCGIPATAFTILGIPAISALVLLKVLSLGVFCAVLSIGFCRLMHIVPKLYERFFPNPFIRVAAGGMLVILLSLLVGSRDYNGAGSVIIANALAGSAKPEAFLLKMVFTTLTLGAGFKGGEIVPVFFTGATFGCVVAPILGLSPTFGAALGMVSVFCGVTNCPMTSFFLSFELFGGHQLPLFALCCAVSYMLSGYYSLYSEQKIVYGKIKPVFINKKAK